MIENWAQTGTVFPVYIKSEDFEVEPEFGDLVLQQLINDQTTNDCITVSSEEIIQESQQIEVSKNDCSCLEPSV